MKRRSILAVPLAVLVVLATIGVGAATAADGRQLVGEFCTNANAQPKPGACMALSYDGQTAQGYTDSPNRILTVRPGTYWLSVNDSSTAHDYSLESPDGVDQDLTGVTDTPGWVTVKVLLTPGRWFLFCDPHRSFGMYVEIDVGGMGWSD